MNIKNVFDNDSKTEWSDPFLVFPTTVALLSVFGLPGRMTSLSGNTNAVPELIVQKLYVEGGPIPYKEDEDPEYFPTPKIVYAEDVNSCCPWALSACFNMAYITIPGTYRLRLTDSSSIGDVTCTVRMLRHDLDETKHIPNNVIFGGAL